MKWLSREQGLALTLVLGLLLTSWGLSHGQVLLAGAGALGLSFAMPRLRVVSFVLNSADGTYPLPVTDTAINESRQPSFLETHTEIDEPTGVVARLMTQARFALVLRERIATTLPRVDLAAAAATLRQSMALVREGTVRIHNQPEPGTAVPASTHYGRQRPIESNESVLVDAFYLDRHTVTNAHYLQFVAAGGYEQMELWEPEIWIAVMNFVDATGLPGPRYWRDGIFCPGEADLPVVGVCWHEAMAYGRWVGRRLPTDAEWYKAAGWSPTATGDDVAPRRYPWGETLDDERANVWGHGPGHIVSVRSYPAGQSAGGLMQLVGNVWEWTSTTLMTEPASPMELGVVASGPPIKVLRGAAYNTYFDSQVTADFRSGDRSTARKANIGFRLALSACDAADALAMLNRFDQDAQSSPTASVVPNGLALEGAKAVALSENPLFG